MTIHVFETHLRPDCVTDSLRSLFTRADMPSGLRCFAMLNGDARGRVLTNDVVHPTWAAMQESFGDRALYLGGEIDTATAQAIFARLRQDGDVVWCAWPDDVRPAQWLPHLPAPDYDGMAIDFTQRAGDLESFMGVPGGCEMRRMDAALLRRKSDYEATVAAFGSESATLAKGLGFCLMRGDDVLCEASTGPPVDGVIELGVATHEGHRERGYAAATCAHLIHACEAMGLATFWNAAAQNAASVALARKLGYKREQPHRVLAWSKHETN